ncbi:MAG: copper homeostasis protein CutC [Saprospiraceae bacterium]
MSFHKEACVVSLSQAVNAEKSGAHRVEICAHLETDGMTPDIDLVEEIIRKINIPVRVMIRSTEEGYGADKYTLQNMIDSIRQFKKIPADGFVIGIMKNNIIDKEAMMQIIHHTVPKKITFHKAIDASHDLYRDIMWLNEQHAIDTLLTSGGVGIAHEGIEKILMMKSFFKKTIMAGGKITSYNLDALHKKTNLDWYHGRSIVGELGN